MLTLQTTPRKLPAFDRELSNESKLCLKREMSSSDKDRSEKLQKLGEKLKSAKEAREPNIEEDKSAWAVGMNYASAFVGAVAVSGGIGFSVDYFAHIRPWGMLVGIIIGFIAGTRSIVQMAQRMSAENSDS